VENTVVHDVTASEAAEKLHASIFRDKQFKKKSDRLTLK